MISNKEKNFISAVVYIRNSEKYLEKFLIVLIGVLRDNFDKYEIICVNDASSDKSIKIIKDVVANEERINVSVVSMGVYQGLELSMTAGIDIAIGDFVFEFDHIDMECDDKLIMDLYRKSLEGYDVVSAVPEVTTGFTSKMFYYIFNRNMLGNVPLSQESFRIISRRALNRVQSLNKNITYRKAVYTNCGLKTIKIKHNNSERNTMKSDNESTNTRIDLAFESLVLFTDAIQKLSACLCAIFFVFTVCSGIYTGVIFFSEHKPVEGWTGLMLFLSVSFSGIFLILTIMLKYMSIILNLIYKKQVYLVESVEKITNN